MKAESGKMKGKNCNPGNCEKAGCTTYDLKRDIIEKVIDGQATEEEKSLYETFIAQCVDCQCRQFCEQEIAIKNLLQTKLDRKRVPLDFVEQIRTRIKTG